MNPLGAKLALVFQKLITAWERVNATWYLASQDNAL